MNVYLVGYQPKYFFKSKHTNWWPWNYLKDTFNDLGYKTYHLNVNKINHKQPGVYICWNEPDSISLIENHHIHPDSIVIQKLTSFDGSPESANTNWSENPLDFFRQWKWPQYQKLEKLEKLWPNFYAFGARTEIDQFPEKKKIVDKYKDRVFWIPWGSMTVPYQRLKNTVPVLDGFKYDVGFVGSKWGTKTRGNILEWETYLDPVLSAGKEVYLAGKGTSRGPVSVEEHERALRLSRLCPVIHATSWKIEKGIMDRFWTVFSLGRFGVVDNEGILDFYDREEVVLETDPGEYVEKSIWYMQHVDKQKPYIEKVLARIQSEYNQQNTWDKILSRIFRENNLTR